MTTSELDRVIAPEIRGDRFWRAIRRVAATPGLRHLVEIGSASGDGSTSAFVDGMRTNPDQPTLHCFEISRPRYEALADRYAAHPDVRCYHTSTVRLERFPTPDDVARFFHRFRPRWRRPDLATQLRWLTQDLAYVDHHGLSADGIRDLKARLGVEQFDAVLIDGSEFTGRVEMEDVYGARFLLLDDIGTFKNYENYRRLTTDPAYGLIEKSRWLRNGYAVFERR